MWQHSVCKQVSGACADPGLDCFTKSEWWRAVDWTRSSCPAWPWLGSGRGCLHLAGGCERLALSIEMEVSYRDWKEREI